MRKVPNARAAIRSASRAAIICDLTEEHSGCSLSPLVAKEAARMAVEARIRELGSRHQSLEQAIQDELRRPAADDIRLQELKRQKLRLKEEMEALRGHIH
jgi:hypothetical protein